MYNEWFSRMSMTLQKDTYFSRKVEMVQAKLNLYFNLPNYRLYFHAKPLIHDQISLIKFVESNT